jgi:Rab proteins geranylgeranyltransferase component A
VLQDGQLKKIPSTREDVFSDESLSMRDKRRLMKFLRFVLKEDEDAGGEGEHEMLRMSLKDAMDRKFKIPESLQPAILALALSSVAADQMPFDKALSRIRRHMSSMGYFGAGFGAVIAKYGGNSEIAQVACRAQAVGGGVYLLGHGLQSVEPEQQGNLIKCTLSDGTTVQARHVFGGTDDMPAQPPQSIPDSTTPPTTWKLISIIANPLRQFFTATSNAGTVPAVALVMVSAAPDSINNRNPVYLQIHSEDTGECPAGQCMSPPLQLCLNFMMIQLLNTYLHWLSTFWVWC